MTIHYKGIDHVQLAAPKGCEERARAFFGNLLGMTEIVKPAELAKRGGVWFQCGVQQLHIGVQEHFSPAEKAHPAFHVENIEALRQQLLTHGIQVKDDEALPGATRFYVNDPFGNRIEMLRREE
ncbi:catechol 2,3-dioxygenase-like lactoylglutathione lyase family enzyme [Pullulanibacillus pueri]|uniref:Glyoxalase n=1 Tax=Pullulanibacillus pueri TaxID=1437324 RepID=A0A8J3EN86_9BACL|nr:VOC family protein [Pullulanibacillus pueri]MBM7683676.1 catechol 2,3-dioxygenase-like lactoylglutathione lyase family enzyme [Pullulanibacillus pueri]GGH87147.1 glyoxalase [Pullulanibacillus pueri]